MSVQGAIDCLRSLDRLGLKDELYRCNDDRELFGCLSENGFTFERFELEEALRTVDTNCQPETEAVELRRSAAWFRAVVCDA